MSLVTFFAAVAKKVTAAPHRGNARAGRRNADASEKRSEPKKERRRQKPNRQRPRREGANAGASDQAKKPTASQTKTLS